MCRVLCDTITARLARFPIELHLYLTRSNLDLPPPLPIINLVAGQVTPRAESGPGFCFWSGKAGSTPAIFLLGIRV